MTMCTRYIKQHTSTTTTKQSGYYYYDERQRREQQYDPQLKEIILLCYELDQTTMKSLQNELGKMVDAKTYDRLNIERKIDDALAGALNIDKTDISKLERLKSNIERSKPKNKAALSMIKNTQDYLGKK